ncbi:MAG: hypothetical protein ABR616_18250 [Dermatophilaceae bacterium]
MTVTFDDRLIAVETAILAAVEERLDAADARVCRAFLAPGSSATWDTCCECRTGREGQAWVAVSNVYPVDPFPSEDAGAQRCSPHEYAADIVVGILRCAHTVDDQGTAPTAAQVTADAVKVARDRALVRDALLCGYLSPDDDPGTFRLGRWTPLGPQGACVGGEWRATVALPSCPCVEIPEED